MVFLLDTSPMALFPPPCLVSALNTLKSFAWSVWVPAFLAVNQSQSLKNSLKEHLDYTERHLKSMGKKKLNKNWLLQCKVTFCLIKHCRCVILNINKMEGMSETWAISLTGMNTPVLENQKFSHHHTFSGSFQKSVFCWEISIYF